MAQIIKWPFGPATTVALTATGAQAIAIANDLTIVDGVTVEATGHRTLNLTVDPSVNKGARLFLKNKTNGVENTVFGTAMQGTTFAGGAGKTKTVECIYDGTNFVEAGTPVQID